MSVTLKQLRHLACDQRVHCETCRTNADWREEVVGVREFDCPHGVVINKQQYHLGDRPCLAGTELKNLLSYLKIEPKEGCQCNARSKIMDEMGCEWCEENIDKIVEWMKEAADKRDLPFSKFIAKRIINLAIYKAKKK